MVTYPKVVVNSKNKPIVKGLSFLASRDGSELRML